VARFTPKQNPASLAKIIFINNTILPVKWLKIKPNLEIKKGSWTLWCKNSVK